MLKQEDKNYMTELAKGLSWYLNIHPTFQAKDADEFDDIMTLIMSCKIEELNELLTILRDVLVELTHQLRMVRVFKVDIAEAVADRPLYI